METVSAGSMCRSTMGVAKTDELFSISTKNYCSSAKIQGYGTKALTTS